MNISTISLTLAVFVLTAPAQAASLRLPTANTSLYDGKGPDFYQFTDRTFRGEKSSPWEAGQYGFVRTPVDTSAGVVFRQFHEGIDIKPVQRDRSGEPRDTVNAIADGTVVHVNHVAGYSNYGRYIVVEHRLGGSRYYSLYAHLNSAAVSPGQRVGQGERLGLLGYTGSGIDKRRAHLHLELCLMLNRSFQSWYDRYFPGEPNRHGIYNGINLAGIDIADYYLKLRGRPDLTIPQFLSMQQPVFKVTVPRQSLDLLQLYPWLLRESTPTGGISWEISFTGSGLPIRVATSPRDVTSPVVSWVAPSPFPLSYISRGYLGGTEKSPSLSASGRRLIALITGG